MCFNCGCFNPNDTMGNPNNITEPTWQQLAAQLKMPVDQLKKMVTQQLSSNQPGGSEVEEMFEKAAKAWGQSVVEAKRNTLELLKTQVK